MNGKWSLWIFTLLVGSLFAIFQLSPSEPLRRLQEIAREWDGKVGSDNLKIHQPCKQTRVEQQRWDDISDVEQVFKETYKPNVDMVVSICREPLDKIMSYATELKVQSLYIYSKCEQKIEFPPEFVKQFSTVDITELPNVGREGHSFLTHVLRTDLNPNRWTIFLQGGIEKTMKQAMLSLTAAHEHDAVGDGTDMINMYRVSGQGGMFMNPKQQESEFCTPIRVKHLTIIGEHRSLRYQSHNGSHKFIDAMGRQVMYRGEFVAKNSLFANLDREKILDIKGRLEKGDTVLEGHYLERFWVGVLGGADNCRCEGMPANAMPPIQFDLGKGKPAKQSHTVSKFAAENALDGQVATYASSRPKDGEDVSWWMLDLQTIAMIQTVTVFFPVKKNMKNNPIENLTLEILDVDGVTVLESRPITDAIKHDVMTLKQVFYFDFLEGRFIRVSKSGWLDKKRTLNIAKVDVSGYSTKVRNPKENLPSWVAPSDWIASSM